MNELEKQLSGKFTNWLGILIETAVEVTEKIAADILSEFVVKILKVISTEIAGRILKKRSETFLKKLRDNSWKWNVSYSWEYLNYDGRTYLSPKWLDIATVASGMGTKDHVLVSRVSGHL